MADNRAVESLGVYSFGEGGPKVDALGVYVFFSATERRVESLGVYTFHPEDAVFPSALNAVAVAFDEVDLSWTQGKKILSQQIHRSTVSGFTPDASTLVATIGGFANTYTDTIPTPVGDIQYFYVIVASDGTTTQQTNEATVTTPTAPPTAPPIYEPYDDQIIVGTALYISFGDSFDAEGDPLTYSGRYRKVGGSWVDAFVDNPDSTPVNIDPFTYAGDGDYELEVWSNDGTVNSPVSTVTFTVDRGQPSAIVITNPLHDDTVSPGTLDITWEHSVDPNSDPLTEYIRYKKSTDAGWTDLHNQPDSSTPLYTWDTSALTPGIYYIEMWANDGTTDSLRTVVKFNVAAIPLPGLMRFEIINITHNSAEAVIKSYWHPAGLAHKSSVWQIMPVGATVPLQQVVVNAPTLNHIFLNLTPGITYQIRVAAIDENDVQGNFNWEEFVTLDDPFYQPDTRRRYAASGVRYWDVDSQLSGNMGGGRGSATTNIVKPAAVGFPGFGEVGSCLIIGDVMVVGSTLNAPPGGIATLGTFDHYKPSEKSAQGIGIVKGLATDSDMHGVGVGLSFGWSWPFDPVMTWYYQPKGGQLLHGSMVDSGVRLWKDGKAAAGTKFRTYNYPTILPLVFTTFIPNFPPLPYYVRKDVTTKYVWYRLIMKVQRYFDPDVKTNVCVYVSVAPGSRAPFKARANTYLEDSFWHGAWTLPNYTPCGYPAWIQEQGSVYPPAASRYFRGMHVSRIEDIGVEAVLDDPVVTPPPTPPTPGVGACLVMASEAPPSAAVLFPFAPNWDAAFEDKIEYLTDIIAAEDDSEQRIQLRDKPVREISYQVLTTSIQESASLKSMIWGSKSILWGVPFWPDAAPLLAPLSAGGTTIDVSYMPAGEFPNTSLFALWLDEFNYELVQGGYVGGSIILSQPLAADWPAFQTHVVPVFEARLLQQVEMDHTTPETSMTKFSFYLDGV